MVRLSSRHIIALGALLLLGAAVLYYYADPLAVWMPKCLFRMLTGLDCPACGSQRAFHALVHGRVGEALGYNPFLVVSIPYLGFVAWTTFCDSGRRSRLRGWVQHPAVIRLYAAIFIFWWIFRNTPLWK